VSDLTIGVLCIVGCLVLIQSGMHIAVALMLLSFLGVWAIKGAAIAGKLLAQSTTTSLVSEVFAVIPMFVIMGLLVSATGMGRDLFDVAARFMRRLRAGLGISTVAANAVFAACTGTSIASASVFTKVAVPEMVRHGFTWPFAVGVVAGSSVLGMLIPPSLLMIFFGVLADTSIGDLFKSGVIPGILLALCFCACILFLAYFRQGFVFSDPAAASRPQQTPLDGAPLYVVGLKFLPIAVLIAIVLGGIYGGIFTPTEAGACGALAAFVIGLLRREISMRVFWQVVLETGRVTCAICFLLMAAQLYSQMLTLSGLPYVVGQWLKGAQLGFPAVLSGYLLVVLMLGCFIDALSIMVILLPFVLPLMVDFGTNMVWFGLITIVAIEIGLLTPPFGVAVFVVKANVGDAPITTWQIFMGTMPMTITMSLFLVLVVLFPWLSLALVGISWSWW
jgi:C4-dicarboxylate transporter DctM subunit